VWVAAADRAVLAGANHALEERDPAVPPRP